MSQTISCADGRSLLKHIPIFFILPAFYRIWESGIWFLPHGSFSLEFDSWNLSFRYWFSIVYSYLQLTKEKEVFMQSTDRSWRPSVNLG